MRYKLVLLTKNNKEEGKRKTQTSKDDVCFNYTRQREKL
jgi:hypothetical protein